MSGSCITWLVLQIGQHDDPCFHFFMHFLGGIRWEFLSTAFFSLPLCGPISPFLGLKLRWDNLGISQQCNLLLKTTQIILILVLHGQCLSLNYLFLCSEITSLIPMACFPFWPLSSAGRAMVIKL